jgi:beta-galactosidase/beta-glucuronidase
MAQNIGDKMEQAKINNRENHPRKIFRRENWSSLNGEWDFLFDDEELFLHPNEVQMWDKKIMVPFAPESPASGIGDTTFHPRCWYRKKFAHAKAIAKTILHFGAVDYQAKVWLNGVYLGSHTGGYTPFFFDISHALNDVGEQILIVCADDDPGDLTKPRGKQDWLLEPHSIWYPRTSGIWQTVWLEEVSTTYIEKIKCTPHLERWEIGVEGFITGEHLEGLELKVLLHREGQVLSKDSYLVINREVHRKIALSDPGIDDFRNELLWSPEKPTLINLEIELWHNDKIIDKIYSYTALRSVSYNRDRFLLNGRPYYLRLVLDQGYWPDTFLTPPSEEAIRKDITLIKAAGFNGVRKHQKIEDPNFYYWADVMGIVVWGEMPSAYRFTHLSVERIVREWTEVMERDMNHPCIITWVPFNESWGVPDLAEKAAHQNFVIALYHLTKTLDPNRPCIGNDGWESTATDILGIHDYDDQPDRLIKKYTTHENIEVALNRYRPGGRVLTVEGFAHKGQPVMLTEFGGISFVEPSSEVTANWGYSAAQSSQEFRRRYEELMNAIHRIEIFAGYCYTQLTDTFQETNGLFHMDRSPKFSINAMARATRGIGLGRGELTSVPQPPAIPHDNDYHESGLKL